MNRPAQRSPLTLVAFAISIALAALAGCKPQIGDSCKLSTDCSTAGDRLCDTSMPSGYCTIFGCDVNTCPDNSICVEFHSSVDRLERTFCMAPCKSAEDCRSEYTCVNVNGPSASNPNATPNADDAIILDTSPASDSVCLP